MRFADSSSNKPCGSSITKRFLLYFSTYAGKLRYDEENELIIDEDNDIVFVPITTENKIIVRYTITHYQKDYPKLLGKKIIQSDPHNGKIYAYQRDPCRSLASITFGRKAHQGGWEKILYEGIIDEDEIDEDEAVDRSETQKEDNEEDSYNDDEEEEEGFDEDEYIEKKYGPKDKTKKASKSDKTDFGPRRVEQKGKEIWIYGEGAPNIKEGKMGYYYRDILTGEIYKKTPRRVLDHINSDSLDNRSSNLREIPFGFNNANKVKQAGCSSKYLGVSWHYKTKKWAGGITFQNKSYHKHFVMEEDAAKFRDIYAVYFYRLPMSNNGMLTEDEIADILENGLEAIPEKFMAKRLIERELPLNIRKVGNKYHAVKSYKGKSYSISCDTLDEAKLALERILNKINDLKEQERSEWYQQNMHELEGEFGYIYTTNKFKEKTGRFKVAKRVWLKYAHLPYHKVNGYPYTTINRISRSLHYLVYKLDHPDYECCVHGTIDHTQRDKTDCTEVNLRAASNSLQKQNRECPKR